MSRAVSTDGFRWAPMPETLLYDTEITANAKLVYLALLRHGTDPTHCYPSRGRLAHLLGISVATVKRSLGELADLGWITIEPRFNRHRAQTSNGYRVHEYPQPTPGSPVNPPPGHRRTPPRVMGDPRTIGTEREEVNERDAQPQNPARSQERDLSTGPETGGYADMTYDQRMTQLDRWLKGIGHPLD